MRTLTGTIILTGLVAGCAPGLVGGDRPGDPHLEPVLVSDDDVPAKQSLLYSAMQDAEVALQSAGYAATADDPADAKNRVSNMLHAIDPAFPGTPTVTASGVTAFWPGTGFGLRPALAGIAEEMRAVSSRHASREQVVEQAALVRACAEQNLERVDRVVSLGQQALAADTAAELAPLVAELDRLTDIVLEAPPAEAADACSLEDARRHLEELALQLA